MRRAQADFAAALAMLEREDLAAYAKVDMLVEMAMGVQQRPRDPADLGLAVRLYGEALSRAENEPALTQARIRARQATALAQDPQGGIDALQRARDLLQQAIPVLHCEGLAAEWAEAQMNLGLVLQSLAAERVPGVVMGAAIAAYQEALRVFLPAQYPAEYAILQNNLATAYLSMGGELQAGKLREALAVQAFETALAHIRLQDHPREYAMLQNNLGNALQSVLSGHRQENCLRALQAYEEALKVRTVQAAPLERANTLANMGQCLASLRAQDLDFEPIARARDCLAQAEQLFCAHGLPDRATLVAASRMALA